MTIARSTDAEMLQKPLTKFVAVLLSFFKQVQVHVRQQDCEGNRGASPISDCQC